MGKHGDEDRHGVVPSATLVVYLTGSTGGAGTAPPGQTLFPGAATKQALTLIRTRTLPLTLTEP